MTISIELPPALEQQLQRAAARAGQDAATFARYAVEEKVRLMDQPPAGARQPNGHSPHEPQAEGQPLDRMLADLIGAVRSNEGRGGSRFSERCGNDFAGDLQEKQKNGSL